GTVSALVFLEQVERSAAAVDEDAAELRGRARNGRAALCRCRCAAETGDGCGEHDGDEDGCFHVSPSRERVGRRACWPAVLFAASGVGTASSAPGRRGSPSAPCR